ncbi:MAG: hypothetical protein K2K83_06250, partial [Rikenella sp.]|nr:hypothetical protein [Rikenella sp.]
MTFQEFQKTIIARCKEAGACEPEFKRLLAAKNSGDRPGFIHVLLDNHWWCVEYEIYDAAMLLKLEDQAVLLEAGLKTQRNHPIEFKVEEIGGKQWKPFNEGASAENGVGDYMTFDEANDPKAGRLVPSMDDFKELCALPSEWALYQGQFGRLFDGRLFIPAGGFMDKGSGTLYYVGYYGFSWASSFTGTGAYRLYFNSGAVNPNDYGHRAYGLQLRCLQ